jgi:hypothetical protein
MNLLDYIMILRGLDDRLRFHEPELYFKPRIIDSLADAIVYDPNYVSYVGNLATEHVERYFCHKRIMPDFMLQPRGNGLSVRHYGALLETENFEHYCSVIASARQFICLASGGAPLAASLGIPALVLFGTGQKSIFHHSRVTRYINIAPISLPNRCLTSLNRHRVVLQGRLKSGLAKLSRK